MTANYSFADSFIIDTKLILGKDLKFKLTVNLLFNICLGLSVDVALVAFTTWILSFGGL